MGHVHNRMIMIRHWTGSLLCYYEYIVIMTHAFYCNGVYGAYTGTRMWFRTRPRWNDEMFLRVLSELQFIVKYGVWFGTCSLWTGDNVNLRRLQTIFPPPMCMTPRAFL